MKGGGVELCLLTKQLYPLRDKEIRIMANNIIIDMVFELIPDMDYIIVYNNIIYFRKRFKNVLLYTSYH